MGAEELLDDEFYDDENEELENEESYDSSSSYLGQPNNGNKFFNNSNNRRKSDDDSFKDNVVPFRKQNSSSNSTNNSLNKKVRSQAKENPKQINLSKPTSKNPKDFLKNSVNKAKNKMQAIHDNKKDKNQKSNNQESEKKKNPIEQVGDEAAKKALSAALQYYRVPKVVADKLVEKYGDKAIDFVKKTTAIATAAVIAPIVLLLLVLIGSIGSDDATESKNSNIANYSEGGMTDEEFYNYLVENGMVDDDACTDSSGTFTSDCDAIKYFSKISDSTDNSDQMLTIYYAMSYDREPDEVYNLHDSEELNSLLNNKNKLKDYINGDYLINYRTDFDSDFDLYSKIESDIFARIDEGYGDFSIDSKTGFKMRVSRAQRTNDLFYKNNPSDLEGECVWYVLGRANEILDNWGVKTDWTYGPNGGEFCSTSYSKNYDIDKIEQGSIISWKYGPYGHVAIVEKVNMGSDGLVQSIVITEGGLGYYNFGKFLVGNSDNFVSYNGSKIPIEQGAHRDFVNQEGGGGTDSNKARRMALCESHGTGCQNSQTLLRDNIKNFNGQNVTRFCTIPLSQIK